MGEAKDNLKNVAINLTFVSLFFPSCKPSSFVDFAL